jgi:uncharacterized membrane protein
MKSRIERWHPLLLSFIITAGYFCFFSKNSAPDSIKDLFSAMISLCGITIGFLATAQSILFSIDKKYVVQQLKNTGVYKKLINYFMEAIRWSFLLAIFSSVGLLMDLKTQQAWHPLAFGAWIFLVAAAGFSYYRVINIFAICRSSFFRRSQAFLIAS